MLTEHAVSSSIKNMLTQKDKEEIEQIVEEKIDEKTRLLPTKDEFFTEMAKVMSKLESIENEVVIIGGRQSEHSDQLEDHETRIGKLEHSPHMISTTA